jgi:hypothetical protein
MKSRRVSAKLGKGWMCNEPLGGSDEFDLSSNAAKVAVVLTQDLQRSSLLQHLQYLLRSLSAMSLQLKVFSFDKS